MADEPVPEGRETGGRFDRGAVVAVAAMLVGVAFVEIVGVFEVSTPWAIARALVLAAATFFLAQAVEADDGQKIGWLWATVASLVLLLAGFGVHSATSSEDSVPIAFEFVVDAESNAQLLRPSAEPGGPTLNSYSPLIGLQSYDFDCKTVLPDGSAWFRLAFRQPTAWADASFLRRPNGAEPVTLPDC